MALIFLDSFDHYSSAQGSRKWTTWEGSIVVARTNNGVGMVAGGPSKTFEQEYPTLTMGFAHKTAHTSLTICGMRNVLNGLGASLAHVGDGRLRVRYDPPGTHGPNVSTFVMNTGEWYYIEFTCEASIVNTTGDVGVITFDSEVWVNGDSILSETFDATVSYSSFVPAGVNHCKFAAAYLSSSTSFGAVSDDCYVTDGERLGDIKVYVLYPNAAGDLTQWTPTGAAANWDCTNEHPANDDTDYVSSPTAGQQDLYNLDNIGAGFSGTIKGAQALWLVKKDDMGAGVTAGLWKSGATTDQGEDFYPSATNYLYDRQAERKSLFTGLDWAESEINALQLGIKRVV